MRACLSHINQHNNYCYTPLVVRPDPWLVLQGGEGEGVYGAPGYGQFAPGFGYPPTTSAPGHPQVQSSTQMSPLAKKSPLLSSLMADPPPPMMTPPMSQPMPPSGPPMMPHGSMPPMSAASMAPQAQQGPQAAHQPPTPQSHLTPMTNVPTTSPYMNQVLHCPAT